MSYYPSAENNITFSCGYIAPIGVVNFVIPDFRCADFEINVFSSGESVSIFEILLFDPWKCLSGENFVVDGIELFRPLLLSTAVSGESTAIRFTISKSLSPINYSGERASASLTIPAQTNLGTVSCYSDESADFELTAFIQFQPDLFSGEYHYDLELTIPESPDLGQFDCYSGEINDIGLCRQFYFFNEIFFGQTLEFDIQVPPPIDLGIVTCYSDQDTAASISSLAFFTFDGYTGCSGKANIQVIEYINYNLIPVNSNCSTSVTKNSQQKTITMTIPGGSGNTCGANFQTPIFSINRAESEFLDICFNRTQNGTWYNDNGTDADFIVYLYIANSHDVTFNSNSEQYYKPSEDTTSPPSPPKPFASFRLRRTADSYNSSGVNSNISYNSSYGIGYNKQHRNNITSDAYDGTAILTFRIKTNNSNPNFDTFQLLENDVVIEELIGHIPNDTAYLVVHFHDFDQPSDATEVISGLYANQDSVEEGYYSNSGESLEVDLDNYIRIISDQYSGQYFDFDLEINPAQEFLFNFYQGSILELLAIKCASSLYSNNYTGEFVSNIDFSTFPPAELASINTTGQYADCDFTIFLFVLLETVQSSGESCVSSLATTTKFFGLGYSDQTLSLDITSNPGSELEVVFDTGTRLEFYLSLVPILLLDAIGTGSSGLLDSIGTEPPIYYYTGCYGEANIAPSYALTFDFYSGEQSDFILDIRPREPIGIFHFYGDSVCLSQFNVFLHADLYVNFKNFIWCQADIDSTTYFDLNKDCNCGGPRTRIPEEMHWTLESAEEPSYVASGNSIIVKVDLSTSKRFRFDAYSGEYFKAEDRTPYLEVDFSQESNRIRIAFASDNLIHRLCRGYFIPSTYNLLIELKDLLPEDCVAHKIYVGQTCSCIVSNNVQFHQYYMFGQHLKYDLDVPGPMEVDFFHESSCAWKLMEMSFKFYTGHISTCSGFYEDSIYAYTGSSMTATELIVEYGVRFKEAGCLDNEFNFQNLSGDIIPELFNPAAVEGEPFKHDLIAECYF